MNKKTIQKTKLKIENSPLFKIVRYFFNNPYDEIHLRGLSKLLKISPYSTKEFLDFLVSIGFLIEEKRANMRYFKANMSNIVFRHLKITSNLKEIMNSGIVEYMKEDISALSSIVLFGSFATGKNSIESDLDLVVIGKKKGELDLLEFEKRIGKDITCFVFDLAEWKKKSKENKAFYQEVISNSIVLYGEIPIVE